MDDVKQTVNFFEMKHKSGVWVGILKFDEELYSPPFTTHSVAYAEIANNQTRSKVTKISEEEVLFLIDKIRHSKLSEKSNPRLKNLEKELRKRYEDDPQVVIKEFLNAQKK